MHKKSKTQLSEAIGGSQCVCLTLTRPDAHQVCIAGCFNDWHPNTTPMIRLSNGNWAKELSLPPGRYEYRFVVDGEWTDDLAAAELIPNPFGTANAVLEIDPVKTAHQASLGSAKRLARQPAINPKPLTQRQSCCT